MSGGGEIIIRNGTLKQWLKYRVIFGAKPAEYGTETEAKYAVPGYVVAFVLVLLGLIVGALVG